MRIKVHWQVDDGYVCSDCPQTTEFTIWDEEWEAMDEDERYECAYDEVYEDFHDKIRPGFSMDDIEIEHD